MYRTICTHTDPASLALHQAYWYMAETEIYIPKTAALSRVVKLVHLYAVYGVIGRGTLCDLTLWGDGVAFGPKFYLATLVRARL